jgi:DNA-binding PadR family transcriptional regulator
MAVLQALAADPGRWRHGYDLCTELGIHAGSMYPILIRLADRGLLETSWEDQRAPGRPARHLYRLSSTGRDHAASVAATAREAGLAPAPVPAPSVRRPHLQPGGA